MTPAVLVAVAHGSRHPEARPTVEAVLDRVRTRRPDADVLLSWLDHHEPRLPAALAGLPGAAVVVPLLLHVGVHTRRDIDAVAAQARHRVVVTPPLATEPALLDVVPDRLAEAGVSVGGDLGLVLVAAGSSDPSAAQEQQLVAAAVLRSLGVAAVEPATAASDDLAGVLARVQARCARVAVVRWFLAPGRLPDAVASTALALDVPCTAVLGPHDGVARAVLSRYESGLAALAR